MWHDPLYNTKTSKQKLNDTNRARGSCIRCRLNVNWTCNRCFTLNCSTLDVPIVWTIVICNSTENNDWSTTEYKLHGEQNEPQKRKSRSDFLRYDTAAFNIPLDIPLSTASRRSDMTRRTAVSFRGHFYRSHDSTNSVRALKDNC